MAALTHEAIESALQRVVGLRRSGRVIPAFQACWWLVLERLGELHGNDEWRQADIIILRELADLAALCDHATPALGIYGALAELLRHGGNTRGADEVAITAAHLALAQGMDAGAMEWLQRLEPSTGSLHRVPFNDASELEQWERSGCAWWKADASLRRTLFSRFYLVAGRMLAFLGQFGDALCALDRGLERFAGTRPNASEALERPQLLVAKADALLGAGRSREAEAILREARALPLQRMAPVLDLRAIQLQAQRCLAEGRLAEGQACLESVVHGADALGVSALQARTRLQLAQVLILLNQSLRAREVLSTPCFEGHAALEERAAWWRAVAIERLASSQHAAGAATSLGTFFDPLRSAARAPSQSRLSLPDGLQRPESLLEHQQDSMTRLLFALRNGRPHDADMELRRMRETFGPSDSTVVAARLHQAEAVMAMFAGDHAQAENLARAASETFDRLGWKPAWLESQLLREVLTRTTQPESPARDESVWQAHVDELTENLSETSKALFLLNKWTASDRELAARIKLLEIAQASADTAARPARWLSQWRVARQIHALLQHLDAERAAADTAELPAVGLWHSMLRHRPEQATLTFRVLPQSVAIIISGRMWPRLMTLTVTRVALHEMVCMLHASLGDIYLSICRKDGLWREAEASAHRSLQKFSIALGTHEWLARLPARVNRLRLVVSDALSGVPWCALRLRDAGEPGDGEVLAARYAISIGQRSIPGPPDSPLPRRAKALVVESSAADLKAAALGCEQAVTRFQKWGCGPAADSMLAKGPSASAVRVMAALQQANLAEFHCHGSFDPRDIERTGILLHHADRSCDCLNLRTIEHLNLSRLRHVSLVACSLADNYTLAARHVLSLPGAFLNAGTGSVLSSLWPVEDELSCAFVERFCNLLEQSLPRDEALRQTQMDFLEGRMPLAAESDRSPAGDDQSRSLLFWAGFVLHGETTPLNPEIAAR